MKIVVLIVFSIFISACSSIPYEPLDLNAISTNSDIGIVVSIPPKIEEYEHTMKINWSGSTESTQYLLDIVPIAGEALSKNLSKKTRANITIDVKKSKEYLDKNINSTNPYFPWQLSPETVETFSRYGKKSGYEYIAFIEGEGVGNIIRGGVGNITPFYGLGIYTENESITYVYASFRVSILDTFSQKNIYTNTCFSFFEITKEINKIDQKVKLTNEQVGIVEKHIPSLIKACLGRI